MNTDDPLGNGGEILTQSEVERLLSQVQAEESSTTVIKSTGDKSRFKHEDIQPCDFRQPAFLTPSELRKLRLRHEDFIRSLAARLSIYLRLEVQIQMSRLQTILYQKFTEALSNPTQLTLFKAEPLRGICLLDIPPTLGLTMVDRLLGGPAHSVNANRDLSEIETALLDQVSNVVLNEWCSLWHKMQELRPVIIGHENNGRFLQTAAHDTVMLCLGMEVRLGDCLEQLQLAFPYFTVESLVRQLGQSEDNARNLSTPSTGKFQWKEEFDDVRIRVKAEWDGLELTARELAQLKPGDVVLLDPRCAEQVMVRLEQLPKFVGRLGTRGDKWAVELTSVQKRNANL
jgi:flagellar motor switch protein FliM